ncbi:TetR/AcrR family transcriptional regulator [Lactiplantibacillus garii]|uniref:TetR/AcrR family transcriptional regulator n=1 Tax=Lactiplantibacillus garii TaxID=2306423 RepID=UPI0013156780|nr:TetR/AcrR family transcriptional regulator [Lactiplantibacillus garii]
MYINQDEKIDQSVYFFALTLKGVTIIKPRQEHILDVATELFHRLGYFQTGIAEINRRAGVSKGVFYHYFPDGKLQLVRCVLQRDYDYSNTLMNEFFNGRDAETAINLFIDNLKNKINTPDYSTVRMSILFSEMMEAKDVDPEIVALAKRTYTMLEDHIEEKLSAAGMDEGTAVRKAKQINAMIEGGVTIGIIKESTEYLEIVSESLKWILSGSN